MALKVTGKTRTSRKTQKQLAQLSPFELKDTLMHLAGENSKLAAISMLNAGRGNPNWIATTPREAFGLLLQFGLEESRRVWNEPQFGIGGMPAKAGIGARLDAFLSRNSGHAGAQLLKGSLDYGVGQLGLQADAFVHELTDAIIGDNYPVPDRMLTHCERIVHEYLIQEICGGRGPEGKFDLFAVEGGTAAMCYVFDSLQINGLLKRGDKVALATPTFTPYVEIPELDRYAFKVVRIEASERRKDGTHTWQYPDSEIDKLADPKVRAFFLVHPSNPPSVAMRESTVKRIARIVKQKNPNLIFITDDVYATFVPGFRSLMADLPQNVIGVYSFSKNFGCTGWRLGVIAVHQTNIFDRSIAALPARSRAALNQRYSTISLTPEKIKFIDRIVADSRSVALNHTAGLSLPQQVQMTLFSLSALLDQEHAYDRRTHEICRKRLQGLWNGMGLPLPDDPLRASYYTELDLQVWAERQYGPEFFEWLKQSYEPVDVLFRLAEQTSVVLMDGGGFGGPAWSVRVSLANLPDDAYPKIGQYLRAVAETYVNEWKNGK